MRFRNFIYFLVEAFKSIKRNRILSIATMTTVAICIMILGLFLLMSLNAGNFMRELESDLEIIAFVDKEIEESRIAGIEEEINGKSAINMSRMATNHKWLIPTPVKSIPRKTKRQLPNTPPNSPMIEETNADFKYWFCLAPNICSERFSIFLYCQATIKKNTA
jgi:hypothetical protein